MLEPWVGIAAGATLVTLVVDRLLGDPLERARPTLDAPLAPRTERRLLLLIVIAALLARVLGWQSAWTPPWWFSEVSILPIDKMLRDGTLWTVWKRQLATTKIDVAHEATTILPLMAGLEALLGPRFGLSVLAGALIGTLVVVLALAAGRQMRSQTFGLVLAALVAFSPMQLMWSRLSAMCTEAVAHVLLAFLVGWLAGRRGSVLLAIVAGLVAWTSFQQYYAARAAVPLAVVGIVAGALQSWRRVRGLVLVGVAVLAFGAGHWAVHDSGFAQSYWPSYQGYLGNKGERSLLELFAQNRDPVVHEAKTTLTHFFLTRRTGWESDFHKPGMAEGGLVSPAIAALGLVGLLAVLRRFGRQWPWLVMAAIGLAMPSLSAASARRTVVLDFAWCGFSAHGLLATVDGLLARYSYRARVRALVGIVGVLAIWSCFAVFGLSAAMKPTFGTHIPFGDAGFGDGVSCRRCFEAAKGWQRDIAGGALVVLFDNDAFRENRTSPGGLPAYGKIAALAAGRREAFVEGYALMAAWDPEPPVIGVMFDRMSTNFVDELDARITRTNPRRIVWHFERPTAWERWLADRLRAAGGVLETFPTPLNPLGGIRVTTPIERRADAMAVIGEVGAGLASAAPSCFRLVDAGVSSSPGNVFLLAPGDDGVQKPPQWIAASWRQHRYGNYVLETLSTPIAAHVAGAGDAQRVEFLCQHGGATIIDLPSLQRREVPANLAGITFALNCAAWSGGHWWLLEAMTGRVLSSHPAAAAIPPGAWIGIGAGPSGEIVLASATQEMLVFDPVQKTVRARFPARVPPAVRDTTDECTPVAVGAGWIGIANLRTTVLSLYAFDGRDLGMQRLDRLLSAGSWITTIGGGGRYLGVPSSTGVRTFEVKLDPTCGTTAAAR